MLVETVFYGSFSNLRFSIITHTNRLEKVLFESHLIAFVSVEWTLHWTARQLHSSSRGVFNVVHFYMPFCFSLLSHENNLYYNAKERELPKVFRQKWSQQTKLPLLNRNRSTLALKIDRNQLSFVPKYQKWLFLFNLGSEPRHPNARKQLLL